MEEVVIVGAGITGVATAVALKRVGMRCLVLERAHELRITGAALSLLPNGWRALDVLGVARKLDPIYRLIENGRVTNLGTGTVQEVSFKGSTDRAGSGVRPVHRRRLLEALVEELDPGSIRFSSKVASIKTETLNDSSTVTTLHLEDGTVIATKICVLIGCDGVHSVVAQWLGLSAPISSGRSSILGLTVFPDGHGFKSEAQIIVQYGKKAGFAPLNETDIVWYSTQTEEVMAREPELIRKEVLEKIAKDLPSDYLKVVGHADLSTITWTPLMLRAPWDLILSPLHKGNVTVAGDAMHPMTPDLAQGGASALEDAVVLARNIALVLRSGGKVEGGIEKYVKERRWRVAGLVAGAYLTGWVQQGGTGVSGWFVNWFRDNVFFRFLLPRIADAVRYDCGELPSAS